MRLANLGDHAAVYEVGLFPPNHAVFDHIEPVESRIGWQFTLGEIHPAKLGHINDYSVVIGGGVRGEETCPASPSK